ncbi:hypothetical protein [Mucilaginibacter polytrichastri]|uniref:Uncharacterized protein n=1 Tax=Mucilaginibacter polytrichastri TaxID=1302689 RepID=A0A1Q6A189_9SPHI|nr:hypothetical protein [Mucilaginibacter polytrichastri]OKS87775.1 hypothetical protein RG47T_3237 [Mucilaginibacter polytrichastri]SFT26755.1 hypothetical protein SAMN04487890_12612 [Mucilaginibacter polytrichastri]
MIKKYLLFLVLILTTVIGLADSPQPNIANLRKQLMQAIDRKQTTDSLYQSLGSMEQRSGLINGYMGALEALKAKHTWNPYYKIKYLNDAEGTFKQAVSQDPHNIEIRFMRFSVEHNVPGFLGYNKNLAIDKQEMIRQIELKNYGTADKELVVTVIKFMIDSKQCNSDENTSLHKQLAALK